MIEKERLKRIETFFIKYYIDLSWNPTQKDFEDYLSGLEAEEQIKLKPLGVEGGKMLMGFKRYYLESKEDLGLINFMQENLSFEDFEYWKKSQFYNTKF